MSLPNYDNWKTTPPDDIWLCPECENENNGDDKCRGCGEPRLTFCSGGRCGSCDGCDMAADAKFEAMRQGDY